MPIAQVCQPLAIRPPKGAGLRLRDVDMKRLRIVRAPELDDLFLGEGMRGRARRARRS